MFERTEDGLQHNPGFFLSNFRIKILELQKTVPNRFRNLIWIRFSRNLVYSDLDSLKAVGRIVQSRLNGNNLTIQSLELAANGNRLTYRDLILGHSQAGAGGVRLDCGSGIITCRSIFEHASSDAGADGMCVLAFNTALIIASGTIDAVGGVVCTSSSARVISGTLANVDVTGRLIAWGATDGTGNSETVEFAPRQVGAMAMAGT